MNRPTLRGDLELLGLSDAWFRETMGNPETLEETNRNLEEVKRKVKQAFRHRSKALHPDTGGDQAEFVKVREAYERIMNLKVMPRQRPVVTVTFTGSMWSSSTNSTTSGTWTTWG